MKHLMLLSLLSTGMLQVNSQFAYAKNAEKAPRLLSVVKSNEEDPGRILQIGTDGGKMSATVFKNQEYCRVELERFDFDVHFDMVGATVYFSGANFPNIEKRAITSTSLKPVRDLMARCKPGSIVVFDEVKVIGPDKKLRTIPGATYVLY